MFVTDGQLHETRRVFIGLGNGNGEKNSIDFRGNSIEKVIIKRSALGRLEFCKKPNSKIRLEQKMVWWKVKGDENIFREIFEMENFGKISIEIQLVPIFRFSKNSNWYSMFSRKYEEAAQ